MPAALANGRAWTAAAPHPVPDADLISLKVGVEPERPVACPLLADSGRQPEAPGCAGSELNGVPRAYREFCRNRLRTTASNADPSFRVMFGT
jgi:hypothetical protein